MNSRLSVKDVKEAVDDLQRQMQGMTQENKAMCTVIVVKQFIDNIADRYDGIDGDIAREIQRLWHEESENEEVV